MHICLSNSYQTCTVLCRINRSEACCKGSAGQVQMRLLYFSTSEHERYMAVQASFGGARSAAG